MLLGVRSCFNTAFMVTPKRLLVALLVLVLPSFASDALAAKYKGKVLLLKQPKATKHLEYRGTVLTSKAKEGPWTLYGTLIVDSMSVKGNEIKISGRRVVYKYDEAAKRLMPLRAPDHLSVRIVSDFSLDEGAAETLLGHLFVLGSTQRAPYLPDYWKPYFTGQRPAEVSGSGNTLLEEPIKQSSTAPRMERPEAASSTSEGMPGTPPAEGVPPKEGVPGWPADIPLTTQPVALTTQPVRIASGVVVGRLIKKVAPTYPEEARSWGQAGSVVLSALIAEDGTMKELYISQPAGLGLDEAAIEAVRQWRYKPYTLQGQPVQVETQITINFTMGR